MGLTQYRSLEPQDGVDASRDPSNDRAQAVAVATILVREDDYLLHKKELAEVSQAALSAVSCLEHPSGPQPLR